MTQFLFATAFREFFFLVVLPFIIWVMSWWGFISGRLALRTDALPYYWDIRFFTDSISRGVYPLWHPDYFSGAPYNFFLRRIGELNPFYWVLSGLKALGMPAMPAHLIFLVLYYFLGLVGFWLLARLFLKDRLTSTGAYLLLLFCWGGQLFYNYGILMFVPLVWFFYFLFAFAQERKRHQFLGIWFTAGIMITTYIPFFTITVIGIFLFLLVLFFMKETAAFLAATGCFFKKHRVFASLALGFFLLSCVPAVDFFLESKGGGFVMPSRHAGSREASQLAVTGSLRHAGGTAWDVLAHGYFDKVFADQQALHVWFFNISYFFFLAFFLTVINRSSRRTAVLLVAAVCVILVSMTKGGHVYPFLLENVFFFRYMRMMHFFLWLAVVPIAILLVMEQLRVFLQEHQGRKDKRLLVFVTAVHVLFGGWLLFQEGIVWSSYLTVAMSLVFFIQAILGRWDRGVLVVLLWLTLVIQPVEFARCIDRNSLLGGDISDRSHKAHVLFKWPDKADVVPGDNNGLKVGDAVQLSSSLYYSNPWYNDLQKYIYDSDIRRFMGNPLYLFNNTMQAEESSPEIFFAGLAEKWRMKKDIVFLSGQGVVPADVRSMDPGSSAAQIVHQHSAQVRVVSFDSNTLRLQVRLDRPQFLLWANGYHRGWHVYIDGGEGRLLRADYAFKGVWIPAGDHAIMFRFATPLRYAGAFALLFVFFAALVTVVVLGLKEGFLVNKEEPHGY